MNDERPPSRRAFLLGVGASAVLLGALTGGQSFGALVPLNAFAPRVKGAGPQSLPVNRTGAQAGVTASALSAGWRLRVTGPRGTVALSRAQLAAMPQASARLPIACVEGWSTTADWSGIRLADLLDAAGIPPRSTIRLDSLQTRGGYRSTTLGPEYARDPLALVALRVNGETLDLDHGYPARIIVPGRPGALQTKWLQTIAEHA
ncbi:molybdopterin-dependent oxidoreductase [Microbacterium mangrovi]|uniref:molybdopterin-dependent oxidoreductase n=1 Tax=Microbacterium mangrovi TaxID=1348253 RepID=UPI000B08EB82|nr:molybdopterin-dependent oxidoreductase [Microbacterium mangrovi]